MGPCEHIEHFIAIMNNPIDLVIHVDRVCVYLLV